MANKSGTTSRKKISSPNNGETFLIQSNIDDFLKESELKEENEVVSEVVKDEVEVVTNSKENKELNLREEQKKKMDEAEQAASKRNSKKSKIISLVFFFFNITVVGGILFY